MLQTLNKKDLIQLTKKQEKVKDELIKHDTGILSATTEFGKTVVAASIIS